MNAPVLRAEQRQHQTLSPRLQHAVRLLQLSSLDFAQEVADTLGRNPFLEPIDGEAEPGSPEATLAASAAAEHNGVDGPISMGLAGDTLPTLQTPDEADFESTESSETSRCDDDGDLDRESWQADGASRRAADDGEGGVMDSMVSETSLAWHLHGQLHVLPLSPRDLLLAKAVVDSLDDDGYLRSELAELVEVTALVPPATGDELQIALRRVQALDPVGVGARNVRECLLLQLPGIVCASQRELAHRIVDRHLESLAAKDVSALARQLKQPPAVIDAICARIRRLDPRPGWRYGSAQIQYVTPDVIVRKHRNRWVATLNPAIVPKVRLNHTYAELFKRHRNAQNGELAAHLQEARWTLRNVEQRFFTIVSVAQAILDRQKHFLEYGPMAMKPLGLKEIAGEVGLHESTVSRVTNNKYMATPAGVFELKYFFSRVMVTASGGACSATAIRGLIKDMIEAEKPTRPLSDAEIARQLVRQGLTVARRTVTKYRQSLRIEAVERRRVHLS